MPRNQILRMWTQTSGQTPGQALPSGDSVSYRAAGFKLAPTLLKFETEFLEPREAVKSPVPLIKLKWSMGSGPNHRITTVSFGLTMGQEDACFDRPADLTIRRKLLLLPSSLLAPRSHQVSQAGQALSNLWHKCHCGSEKQVHSDGLSDTNTSPQRRSRQGQPLCDAERTAAPN